MGENVIEIVAVGECRFRHAGAGLGHRRSDMGSVGLRRGRVTQRCLILIGLLSFCMLFVGLYAPLPVSASDSSVDQQQLPRSDESVEPIPDRECDSAKCEKQVTKTVDGKTYTSCVNRCKKGRTCVEGKCWEGPRQCYKRTCRKLVTREMNGKVYARCIYKCRKGENCFNGKCIKPCNKDKCERLEIRVVGEETRSRCVSRCGPDQTCVNGKCRKRGARE